MDARGNTERYSLHLPKIMFNQKSLPLSLLRQKTRATKIQLSSHTPQTQPGPSLYASPKERKEKKQECTQKKFHERFLELEHKDRQTETERNGILLSLYLKSYLRICSTKWAFLHQIRNLKSGEREVQEVTYQREVGLRVSEEKHRHHRGRAE